MIRHTIWNSDIDIEDWLSFLEEEYPDRDIEELKYDHEVFERILDENYELLNCERENLSVHLDNPILVIADLGLWDGRHNGYRIIESGCISDCLYSTLRSDSDCHWYINEHGDLACTESHHDGTNHYIYRGIRPTKSGGIESRIDILTKAILNGTLTDWQKNHYTYRLGDYIAEVYGWKISQRGKGGRIEA